jgi:phosphoribosylamine--glycine ligase
LMIRGLMGDAGRTVLLEERLEGPEVTVLSLVDGEDVTLLLPSCDHKPLYEGDNGPNTGGMGAYAPTRLLSSDELEEVRRSMLIPVARELASRGTPYRGVLYAGLILTRDGPMVLEFNCRFGDPEAQAVLPLFDGDFGELLQACAEGQLARAETRWRQAACVCVVLASHGYPGAYEKGLPIAGLDKASQQPGTVVFHAGTSERDGHIVTAGGRVLGVTAWAGTLRQARERAYRAVEIVRFDGVHFRRDIGMREETG